jgi:hypothetical protein
VTTYYACATGSNDADGRSTGSPWRDWTPLDGGRLRPGDTLRLRGGDAFPGGLYLDGSGGDRSPITVESYGTGRAVLVGGGRAGVYGYAASRVGLHGLVLDGAGASATADGISLFTDVPGHATGIRVADCEVSGWKNGITVGGRAGGGFADVLVSDCDLHHNRDAGLATYGPRRTAAEPAYAHRDVRVLRTRAHDQTGDAENTTTNSGSGIVLGSVDNSALRAADAASVEHCVAHGNGAANAAAEGPAGIWCYDSTGVVVQHCVAHDNRTGTTADGDGFDLDLNTTDSVVRWCLAHGNAGAGIMLYASTTDDGHHGNLVHDNVCWGNSVNHAWYGQITVHGRVGAAEIRDNTCIGLDTAAPGSPVLSVGPGADRRLVVRGNVLAQRGDGPVVAGPGAGILMEALVRDNDCRTGCQPRRAPGPGRWVSILDR